MQREVYFGICLMIDSINNDPIKLRQSVPVNLSFATKQLEFLLHREKSETYLGSWHCLVAK